MDKTKKVLITGGTGLLGKHIAKLLLENNYEVAFLSRKENLNEKIKRYKWDLNAETIDLNAFKNVTTIIHLAGENVASGLWTKKRKAAILKSRIESANLLFNTIKQHNIKIESFICANAIGIYGDRKDEILTESATLGSGFLAEVCKKWQNILQHFENENIRTASFRVGLVLDKKSGVLPKLVLPAKFRINAILGNGKQFYSWIHIKDLAKMVFKIVEDKTLNGNYNCVAPNPVSNQNFIKAIEKQLGYKTLKPKVPAFLLKTLLGEMATIVLASAKVIPEKILETGFKFEFEHLEDALKDLM